VVDLVSIFGGPSHQLPVEQHVADDGVEHPAVVERLELDLDESRRRHVEAHGQLESIAADSRCEVAEAGSIQRWKLWYSTVLVILLFLFLIFYTPA